jgi:tetratricopeptide (TPR) repeat protein
VGPGEPGVQPPGPVSPGPAPSQVEQAPRVEQAVTATAGFAYGVIGASVHVFGTGVPLYVLENWRPPPSTDPAFLRELPSRMLNARFAVVEFTGRERELAGLRSWREEGPRLAVRWLHAPGGQGKSRLAAEFARTTLADGWKVVTATHGPGTVLPPPGSQDLRTDGTAGLLLIVDYADRWPLTHLTWLFSNALLHRSEVRTRVLLLARSADAWPAVRASLANHAAATSAYALAPLPEHGGEGGRGQMFTAARDAFAVRYGIPAAGIAPPAPLDHPDYGLTLAVHMAALVAIDARATGRRAPTGTEGLTLYLLDREHLHWARLYGDPGHDRDVPATAATPAAPAAPVMASAPATFVTPPEVMNRAVFTAALTGPVDGATGTALLTTLALRPSPQRVLADHAVCYPPADPAARTVLEPLYPDRLAEDFLALTLPGHHADYPAQPWAGPTTTTLLDQETTAPDAWTARAVTFLANAAQRWPHVAARHLYPLLRKSPVLAVAAGSATLMALAALENVDMEVLEAVHDRFPEDRHVDLDAGMAAVTARLAPHQLAAVEDPGWRAVVNRRLAARLHAAGLDDRALGAARDAVAEARRWLATDPSADPQALAACLEVLGAVASELGLREEGAAVHEELVSLTRRLVRQGVLGQDALATTLVNAGRSLMLTGRQDEALGLAEEAVALARRAATAGSSFRGDLLVEVLTGHADILRQSWRRQEAVAELEEAALLLREWAGRDPQEHGPSLAAVLDTLAGVLVSVGRQEEAVALAEETIALHRRLAERNPGAFDSHLAIALNNQAVTHARGGRLAEALVLNDEALALSRRLAATRPAAHEPLLGTVLQNRGDLLCRAGRPDEALATVEEALAVYRRLARGSATAFAYDLGLALMAAGRVRHRAGDLRAAVAYGEEAAAVLRGLAADNPATHESLLARALQTLGDWFSETGQDTAALAVREETVVLLGRLAERNAVFAPDLRRALSRFDGHLSRMGASKRAAASAERVLTAARRLAGHDPSAFNDRLAQALLIVAREQGRLGRWESCAAANAEAVALYEAALAQGLAPRPLELAGALVNLATALLRLGRAADALAHALRALTLCREHGATDDLADVLAAEALSCCRGARVMTGAFEEARAADAEILDLCRRRAAQVPDTFLPILAETLERSSVARFVMGHAAADVLSVADEAVDLFERLAETRPAEFTGRLHAARQSAADLRLRLGAHPPRESGRLWRPLRRRRGHD